MRHPSRLRVESLESRDNPATFGTPWPDGEHLTLSLAPDGTTIGSQSNSLADLFTKVGPQAFRDLLRSFQTWASNANINIGLVDDAGAAFGTGGAIQGDPRFGDIRIGGIPLANDVLAVTAPYGPYDNYSGDVVVNTAAPFASGDIDLYTVILQEAGHALGVGNSPELNSAMYEYYRGPRTALSAGDVAAIQSLYGARAPDRFEGNGGNGTRGTAARYLVPLQADLHAVGDVDVYRIGTGLLTRSITVDFAAAGLSLLTAKVELLDSNGAVLAAASATDPTKNDLVLNLTSVRNFATYYVRVSSGTPDGFDVGSYKLAVTQNSLLTAVTGFVTDLLDETGLNDTLATATTILSRADSVGSHTEFSTEGGFGSPSDLDHYRIAVPAAGNSEPVNLVVTAWALDGAVLDPWIEVFDSAGNRLASEVLTANGNAATVQLRDLSPGRSYSLRLSSDSHRIGKYRLVADLGTTANETVIGPTRSLDTYHPSVEGGFSIGQSGQIHFVLMVDGEPGIGHGVDLLVIAGDGTIAASQYVAAGRARSLDILLSAGTYKLQFRSRNATVPLQFHLCGEIVTDPIGATVIDPTGSPEPTNPPPPVSPPTSPPPGSQPSSPPPTKQLSNPVGPPTPPEELPPADCEELAFWY